MDGVTVREQAVSTLNEMRDEDIEQVLEFMLLLKAEAEHLEHYDPTQDPVLTGEDLFDGPGDLSTQQIRLIEEE